MKDIVSRLSDELVAAKELLGCIRNGTDVCRPDVDLDGILVTRELEARIEAFLTNPKTNRIRDFIMQKSDQIKKSLDHDEHGDPLPNEREPCQHPKWVAARSDQSPSAKCGHCGEKKDAWYCPQSPRGLCDYRNFGHDQCSYCGQPEERK